MPFPSGLGKSSGGSSMDNLSLGLRKASTPIAVRIVINPPNKMLRVTSICWDFNKATPHVNTGIRPNAGLKLFG